MLETNDSIFIEELQKIGIFFSKEIYSQLFLFIKELLKANQQVNLTSITDYREALYKHLYDALLISEVQPFINAKQILDIGSGGGIPAIPLAIAYPDKTIFSLEATQKKINFQLEMKEKLKLPNFHPIWNRAEILAQDKNYRGQFDLVTARAVAAANILTELTIPFTKTNSFVLLYKGKDVVVEVEAAKKSLICLHAILCNIYHMVIPFEYGERNLVLLKKTATTSEEFPRKPGIPQKKPII